ncbi:hypothetical protein ACQPZX_14715 [Actinoplanes sp. CA-142083]|uniref:hypothetical protein n=1 Tax=Actinoplanes sp. CA-142083 TaxID=3239903 RepID=UPI003D938D2E
MTYPPQPSKRRRASTAVLGGVAVVLVLGAGAGIAGAFLNNDKDTAGADAAETRVAEAGAQATGPTADNVKLTAKITQQTCYGDAGCAVTWHPEVTYTGPVTGAWVISYDISGIGSGPDTGRIVMSGATPAGKNDQQARTAAKDSQITLKVTGVELG